MVASRAGDFLEPQRDIGLRAQIELHVGIDRERIKTFLAETTPVTVCAHEPFVDGKTRLFTDGAGHRAQAPFHFLLGQRNH